jgi:hypothetical protein
MSQAGVLAVRALAGGTLVVVCAVAGELLRPKSFAGILAAIDAVKRFGAMRGSLASLMVWAAVASGLYVATPP